MLILDLDLTFQCRRILKGLLKKVKSEGTPITVLPNENRFQIDLEPDIRYYNYRPTDTGTIYGVLERLEEHGYIDFDESGSTFYLTYQALKRTDIVITALIRYILSSLIVPIIISVITTLVTLALSLL